MWGGAWRGTGCVMALACACAFLLAGCQGERAGDAPAARMLAQVVVADGVATFNGPRNNYAIVKTGTGFVVTDTVGTDGVTVLGQVARLRFADMSINPAVAVAAAAISASDLRTLIECYVVLFNREPGADALASSIAALQGGASLATVAQELYNSISFISGNGFIPLTRDTDLVRVMYSKLLGRGAGNPPSDAEVAQWLPTLRTGSLAVGNLVMAMLSQLHQAESSEPARLLANKVALAKRFSIDLGLSYNDPDAANVNGAAVMALVTATSTSAALARMGVDDVPFSLTAAASPVPNRDQWRLARQATFGPNEATLAAIAKAGIEGYVDQQLSKPSSQFAPLLNFDLLSGAERTAAFNSCGVTPNCLRDNMTLFQVRKAILQHALTGEDQLRQRVAYALAQIFTISSVKVVEFGYSWSELQKLFLDNAFGNYRDLLDKMTRSPMMGIYLDMAGSTKANAARLIQPNQNYAREVLQLFSIGVYRLNQDGSQQLDGAGQPIPAYTQSTIEEFARAFTGWNYDDPARYRLDDYTVASINFARPMVAVAEDHDTGAKQLLLGGALPAGQSVEQDLKGALDNIFAHPNVGPHVGRLLIQHLVTGAPSAAYVGRVAAVFNDNGSAVRGDLKAVVRAILLDPEARGDFKVASDYGMLMDPLLYVAGALRGLGVSRTLTDDDAYTIDGLMTAMGQKLLMPPTVFGYYSSQFRISSGANGPAFGILDTRTAASRRQLPSAFHRLPDYTPWVALAATPAVLVDRLNWTFANGNLPNPALALIINAVEQTSASEPLARAQLAAGLVISARQSQIAR